ncbi:MAG: glycosyl hydrolase family 57, partial [Methylococcales bacterium]
MTAFSSILAVDCPESLVCASNGRNPAFEVTFRTDGEVAFPQVILHGQGTQKLINEEAIRQTEASNSAYTYVATVPEGLLSDGAISVQIEGCRLADLSQADSADWIKEFRDLRVIDKARPAPKLELVGDVKVYFGIHKHMHQPYYQAADPTYWDGEKDEIFGSRSGNYTSFIPTAVRQYIDADLPHAGLSTSWS